MTTFDVKQTYFPVASAGTGGAEGSSCASSSYKPTLAECATLTESISYFLSQCSCYDMMGMSTQVVVLDLDATLAVAFIAAQETRVQSCVLWDGRARKFVGVLSSTDYIKILLYCERHTEEAAQVSSWTIRHWRDVKDKVVNPQLEAAIASPFAHAQPSGPSSTSAPLPVTNKRRPTSIVTCEAETTLKDCLERMMTFNVRRIVALAEKEAECFSVVAMIDVAQIVEYLGAMFFHIERAGGLLWNHPNLEERSGSAAANAGAGTTSMNPLGGPAISSADGAARKAGGAPGSAAGSGLGTATSDAGLFALGESMLPPHVTSILAQAESTDAAATEPRVGPYRSIFDIPFVNLPSGVGAHRSTPICVLLDSKLDEALWLLLKYDIETIAVCSEEKTILDVISRSDLLRIENQGVYDTSLTVREALSSKQSERIFVFFEHDSVRDVFAHFVRRRVKELFIVDRDTGKLKGQLNVAEFVFFLVFANIKNTPAGGARSSNNNSSSSNSNAASASAASTAKKPSSPATAKK